MFSCDLRIHKAKMYGHLLMSEALILFLISTSKKLNTCSAENGEDQFLFLSGQVVHFLLWLEDSENQDH